MASLVSRRSVYLAGSALGSLVATNRIQEARDGWVDSALGRAAQSDRCPALLVEARVRTLEDAIQVDAGVLARLCEALATERAFSRQHDLPGFGVAERRPIERQPTLRRRDHITFPEVGQRPILQLRLLSIPLLATDRVQAPRQPRLELLPASLQLRAFGQPSRLLLPHQVALELVAHPSPHGLRVALSLLRPGSLRGRLATLKRLHGVERLARILQAPKLLVLQADRQLAVFLGGALVLLAGLDSQLSRLDRVVGGLSR